MDFGCQDGDLGVLCQESVDSTWSGEERDDMNFLFFDAMFLENCERLFCCCT